MQAYAISPSGAVPQANLVDQAVSHLAAAGLTIKLDRTALKRVQRFAGTDQDRIACFARAARQKAPIVMITRGGYGITRLLPELDYQALAGSGKAWVGFSDFTAFQLAMLAQAKAVTWSGPALIEDFGKAQASEIDENTRDVFFEAMRGELEVVGFEWKGPAAYRGLEATGTLWGGNLSVLCSLMGSPYFPKVKGGILMLEEVGDHPYRLERWLTQLLHAGVLDQQKAVLLGGFNQYKLVDHDAGFDMPAVVKWLRSRTTTPIIQGLPFGHGMTKLTLPHGAKVSMVLQGKTAFIVLPHSH
jgi:muramoyltetrapeptide carboxypeptidase